MEVFEAVPWGIVTPFRSGLAGHKPVDSPRRSFVKQASTTTWRSRTMTLIMTGIITGIASGALL
jgi:hypothetical protein